MLEKAATDSGIVAKKERTEKTGGMIQIWRAEIEHAHVKDNMQHPRREKKDDMLRTLPAFHVYVR